MRLDDNWSFDHVLPTMLRELEKSNIIVVSFGGLDNNSIAGLLWFSGEYLHRHPGKLILFFDFGSSTNTELWIERTDFRKIDIHISEWLPQRL